MNPTIISSITEASVASTPAATSIVSGASKSLANIAKVGGIVGAIALAGFGIYKVVTMVKKDNAEIAEMEAETDRICAETEQLAHECAHTISEMHETTEQLIDSTEEMLEDVESLQADADATKDAAQEAIEAAERAKEAEQKAAKVEEIKAMAVAYIREQGHSFKDETAEETVDRYFFDARDNVFEASERMSAMNIGMPTLHGVDLDLTAIQSVYMNIEVLINGDKLTLQHEAQMAELTRVSDDLAKLSEEADKPVAVTDVVDADTALKAWFDEHPFANSWEAPGSKENAIAIERFRAKISSMHTAISFATTDGEGKELSTRDIVQRITRNLAALRFQMLKTPENEDAIIETFMSELVRLATYSEVTGSTISAYAVEMIEFIPSWIDTGDKLKSIVINWDRDELESVDDALDAPAFRSTSLRAKTNMRNEVENLITVVTNDLPKHAY